MGSNQLIHMEYFYNYFELFKESNFGGVDFNETWENSVPPINVFVCVAKMNSNWFSNFCFLGVSFEPVYT